MQNSPTIFSASPPSPQLPLPPPPHYVGQINVLPAPPPPAISQFPGAPSSVFQITVLPVPPPPPFTGDSSSADFSPLEFLFAIIAIVTIPALIYIFIFAFRCSSSGRSEHAAGEFSRDSSVPSESPRDDIEATAFSGGVVSDVKYRKESTEIGGECPVCLSIFSDGEEVRQLSACKHAFHASCIDMWLTSHSNCPICRATIPSAVAADDNKRSSLNSSAENHNRDGDLRRQGHRDANAMV